jgi:voltage-gated potassium channel
MIPPKRQRFRHTLQFYLIDCRSPLGKLIDIAIAGLNLLVCALLVLETYPISQATRQLLWQIEIAAVVFFVIEYIARLYAAPQRLRQLRDIYSIIDLVAIMPTFAMLAMPALGLSANIGFVRMLRIFRVFRIFRFLRFTANPDFFFGSISWPLLKVILLIFTIVMIFFISAGLFYEVEHSLNPKVQNFGDAFYFTVVALTTVGFGDITPLSQPGKWVTVLMILSGIILIPWQAGKIVKEWIHLAQKREVVCSRCGLRYHDKDASHCKACGEVIYQVYDGD